MPPDASRACGHWLVSLGAFVTFAGAAVAQVPTPAGSGLSPLGGSGAGEIAVPTAPTGAVTGSDTVGLLGSPMGGSVPLDGARRGLEGATFRPLGLGLPPGEPGPPVINNRGYTFTPSLGGQQLYTDNLQQSGRGQRSEFITTISPGLLATVDTTRLKGVLDYNPSVQIYASDGQTRVLQRLNGQLLVTLLPQLFFVDLRGSANVQSAGGGFAPQTSPVVTRNNQVQTTVFQISPYLLQRFGDLATVQAGYAFQSVTQNAGGTGGAVLTPGGQRLFVNQSFIANELFGVARTGRDFGRLTLEGRVVSTDYDGNGVLRGAYRRSASVEARYSLTRWLAVLGDGGYTSQRYAGNPPFRLDEPTWGAGFRVSLGQESFVTLRYLRRDGFEAPQADASIMLGGRTRLFASYNERLATGAQRAADFLSSTNVDALGNLTDVLTGGPVLQPFADSFLGTQINLQRTRRAVVTISQSWPRDTINLSLSSERRRTVGLDPTIPLQGLAQSQNQSGQFISIAWTHDLSPVMSATGSLQYGRLERLGSPKSSVYSASATLLRQLNPRLNSFLQYGHTRRSDVSLTGGNGVQNLVVLGVRQSF